MPKHWAHKALKVEHGAYVDDVQRAEDASDITSADFPTQIRRLQPNH